jgi:hypothetical protein
MAQQQDNNDTQQIGSERAQSILNSITSTECSICLSNLTHANFTSTKCGHWFHSSCIFQNMVQRVECPLCRTELAEISDDDSESLGDDDTLEYSTEEEEEGEESDDEEDDESLGGTSGESATLENGNLVIDTSITCKQATQKMSQLGYSMEDLMYLLVGRLDPREKSKYKREFRDKMETDLSNILNGEIQVDYRDSRTYAEVMSGKTKQDEAGIGPATVSHTFTPFLI